MKLTTDSGMVGERTSETALASSIVDIILAVSLTLQPSNLSLSFIGISTTGQLDLEYSSKESMSLERKIPASP